RDVGDLRGLGLPLGRLLLRLRVQEHERAADHGDQHDDEQPGEYLHYSVLRASIGLIDAACDAGMMPASAPAVTSTDTASSTVTSPTSGLASGKSGIFSKMAPSPASMNVPTAMPVRPAIAVST